MVITKENIDLVKEAREQKLNVDVRFEAKTREEAEDIIKQFANALDRTWQAAEYTSGHGHTKWLEIVNHDEDTVEITVYYDTAE